METHLHGNTFRFICLVLWPLWLKLVSFCFSWPTALGGLQYSVLHAMKMIPEISSEKKGQPVPGEDDAEIGPEFDEDKTFWTSTALIRHQRDELAYRDDQLATSTAFIRHQRDQAQSEIDRLSAMVAHLSLSTGPVVAAERGRAAAATPTTPWMGLIPKARPAVCHSASVPGSSPSTGASGRASVSSAGPPGSSPSSSSAAAAVPPRKMLGIRLQDAYAHECGIGFQRRHCSKCTSVTEPKSHTVYTTLRGDCYHENPLCKAIEKQDWVALQLCGTCKPCERGCGRQGSEDM